MEIFLEEITEGHPLQGFIVVRDHLPMAYFTLDRLEKNDNIKLVSMTEWDWHTHSTVSQLLDIGVKSPGAEIKAYEYARAYAESQVIAHEGDVLVDRMEEKGWPGDLKPDTYKIVRGH